MEQTPMEKIKAFHSIKSFLNEEQRELVADMLQLNDTDLKKRIWGKDNELDFILKIYLLENCKSIYAFEEGISKLTESDSCDLLIELKTGKKIIVEIKSTEDIKYKMSQKVFDSKLDFANMMGAELFFAFKLNDYWVLYDYEYVEENDRKITLEKGYLKSKMDSIFGDKTFIYPPGLKIESIYSKKVDNHLGVLNDEYGNLIKYTIKYKDKKIISINSKKNDRYYQIFLYSYIENVAHGMKKNIKKIDDGKIMIVNEIKDTVMLKLSNFLTYPINCIRDRDGVKYDTNKYIRELIDNKNNMMINLNSVLYCNLNLAENGYDIMEVIGERIYSIRDTILR